MKVFKIPLITIFVFLVFAPAIAQKNTEYDVREHYNKMGVDITMKDSIKLHTTIYSPKDTFKKGHKLQIRIQSTWFPLIDLNPQTFVDNIFEAEEEDFQKQTHTVYGDSTIKFSILEG